VDFEFVLQDGVAFQRILARSARNRMFEAPHLAFRGDQRLKGLQRLFEDGTLPEIRNLIEAAEAKAGSAKNGTAVRLHRLSDKFQQGALAAPVGADQAGFFTGIDLKGNVVKDIPRAE
jgi:hypothetical protein